MRIVQILPTAATSYGGPVESARLLHQGYQAKGCDSVLVPAVANQTSRLFGTTVYWPGLRGSRQIARHVQQADIVHIHGLWTLPAALGGIRARATSTPYVVTIHGMLKEWSLAQHGFRKRVYAALFGRRQLRSAFVHALTSLELRSVRDWGIDAPVFLVPNGIDTEAFLRLPNREALNARYPDVSDRTAVLFLGRLAEEKGIDLLVRAFAKACVREQSLHLFLAGPGKPATQTRLQREVGRLGLVDRVTFTGEVRGSDKLTLLGGCDLFVQLSHSEGDSMALKEAMASGLPLVVSEAAASGVVRRAGAGLVVSRCVDEVTEAITRLTSDPEEARRMGRRGRDWARSELRYTSVAERMLAVYSDILEGTRRAPDWVDSSLEVGNSRERVQDLSVMG